MKRFPLYIKIICFWIGMFVPSIICLGQQFNKTYYFSNSNFGVIQSIEYRSANTLAVFTPRGFLNNTRIGLSPFVINMNGDTLLSKNLILDSSDLKLGWSNASVNSYNGGFVAVGSVEKINTVNSFVVGYNHNLDTTFLRIYGDTGNYSIVRSIIQSPHGGYIATGQHNFNGIRPDGWLLKLDTLGNKEWEKFYSVSLGTFEVLTSVVPTYDGGYIMGGLEKEFPNQSTRNYDPILLKVDSAGNQMWRYKHDTPYSDETANVIQLFDSSFLFTTSLSSSIGGLPHRQAMLVKVDRNGNLLWAKNYGTNGFSNTGLLTLKQLADSNIVAAGSVDYWGPLIRGLFLKVKPNGDSIYVHEYEATPSVIGDKNTLRDIIEVPGGFMVTGDYYDDQTKNRYPWILRLDSNGCLVVNCLVGLEQSEQVNEKLEIFPNPTQGLINYTFENAIDEIAIYDMNGRLVKKIIAPNNKSIELPEPSGLYLICFQTISGKVFRKKVIKN